MNTPSNPPRSVTFAATGDSLINRRLAEHDEAPIQLAALIGQADFRFTNLETVVRHDDEGFPSAQSGGTWTSTRPESLRDLKAYGFNIVSWATNHTLDYSYGGLEATARHLDAAGLVHAGAGATLGEAGAIRYLETRGGRVALIAATSTFHESWIAGNARYDLPGRPGVNPLRFKTETLVSPDRLAAIEAIASECLLNAQHELRVKEGFSVADPEGVVRLGPLLFRACAPGETPGTVTRAHEGDLQRIRAAIGEARRQADLVAVSIHSHEMRGARKDRPADFLVEFAHACIDEGAHAVIGHGPHLLRAVEVYRERPIFYSLGNFIFQSETVTRLPADFYEQYGLGPEAGVADALDRRSANGTRGLGPNPKIWHSVIATWRMEEGRLRELALHPISLGFGEPRYRRGSPRLTANLAPLEELQALSREFGTELCLENGRAVWRA